MSWYKANSHVANGSEIIHFYCMFHERHDTLYRIQTKILLIRIHIFLQLPRNPRSQLINVLEVDDPKISIVFHMIAPMEPLRPLAESPLAEPMVLLRQLAREDLDRAKELQTKEGFLLKNLEANCKYNLSLIHI